MGSELRTYICCVFEGMELIEECDIILGDFGVKSWARLNKSNFCLFN